MTRNHRSHVLAGYRLAQQAEGSRAVASPYTVLLLSSLALLLLHALLQLRDGDVLELSCGVVVALAHGRLQLPGGLLHLLLHPLVASLAPLLRIPLLHHLAILCLLSSNALLDGHATLGASGVVVVAQRLQLDARGEQLSLECVQRVRLALLLHAQTRSRLVDEVYRLVGQLALREVALTHRSSADDGPVGDVNAMM